MGKCKDWIKRNIWQLDIMSSPVQLTYKGQTRYHTGNGLTWSFIFYGLLLIYTVVLFVYFIFLPSYNSVDILKGTSEQDTIHNHFLHAGRKADSVHRSATCPMAIFFCLCSISRCLPQLFNCLYQPRWDYHNRTLFKLLGLSQELPELFGRNRAYPRKTRYQVVS